MAEFRKFVSLELDDDEKFDRMFPDKEPPDFPEGMTFSVSEDQLSDLGVDGNSQPGATLPFAAMIECRSNMRREDSCRIEAEIVMLALGDGKLMPIDDDDGPRPTICLTESELEKLDMEDACEQGDTIHLIGTVKVVGNLQPSFGPKRLELQILEASAEDEDQEETR